MITLDEAKAYLRVDSGYDDFLITSLLKASESLCIDVARLSKDEWDEIFGFPADSTEGLCIRSEEKAPKEILRMREILRIGVLYSLGYLYEHREEADHHDLVLTLRNLLFSVREGVL